jgi:hypothetical protein
MIFTISEKQGPNGLLLVITDSDILGKIFEEGNKQLDLTAEFYSGVEKSREEVVEILDKAQDIHATGTHSVGLLVELDMIDSKNILYVDNTPHAQIVVSD